MNSTRCLFATAACLLLAASVGAQSARLVDASLDSDLVPGPVEYYALLPPGYDDLDEPLPLVLHLHGGGGSRDQLKGQQQRFTAMWEAGTLPPMVIVMPSVTPRCFYMDYQDGSQKWESFLIGPFLTHLRETLNVRTDRQGTALTGASMGGMGSLRLAFKYPDIFGAVAALEPAIAPIDDWNDMRPKHRFWRADDLMESIYGKPVDRDFWNANNPATIAQRQGDVLRESGLRIFIEAGDEDMLWLYEGAEHLHRVLWDLKIRHEYRLYYGADHIGRSLVPRSEQAYLFLAAAVGDAEPDPAVEAARERTDQMKRGLEEADHYGIDKALIKGGEGQ